MTEPIDIAAGASPASASHENTCLPLKFTRRDRFIRELRRRVDEYFVESGRSKRDCPQMYFKTAIIMTWFITAYVLLLVAATHWWSFLPLAVVMGFAMAAVGFNIQHDGGHKAYSKHKWVNKLMGLTIELVGGSSYLWDWKHNAIHHTYTNINGHDDDINVGFLGRLSPSSPDMHFIAFKAFLFGALRLSGGEVAFL